MDKDTEKRIKALEKDAEYQKKLNTYLSNRLIKVEKTNARLVLAVERLGNQISALIGRISRS